MSDPRWDGAITATLEEEEKASRWDAGIDRIAGEQNDYRTAIFQKALEADPDRLARVLRVEKSTGFSRDIVDRNLDLLEKRIARTTAMDPELFRKSHPELSKLFEDPDFAGQAVDDTATLSGISWLLRSGLDALEEGMETGTLSSLVQKHRVAGTDPWKDPQILEIARRQGRYRGSESFLEKSWTGVANLIGAMAAPSAEGMAYGGVAAGATVLAGPGAPIAAGPAFGAGYVAGTAKGTADLEANLAYLDMMEARNGDQPAIDPNSARLYSTAAGLFNGALEVIPGLQEVKRLPVLSRLSGAHELRKQALAEARRALKKSTTGRAVRDAAVGALVTTGSETLTEGAQKVVTLAAEEDAKRSSREGKPLSEWGALAPRTGRELAGEAWSEMSEAARSMWLLSLLGVGVDLPGEIQHARRTRRNTQFLELLGAHAENSTLAQRAPEEFRKAVQAMKADGPVQQVFIPVERWDAYWKAQKQDPSAVAEIVLGDRRGYEAAQQSKGDLVVPLEDYTTRVAGTGHHPGLSADIRLRQGDRTLREQAESSQGLSQEIVARVEAFANETPDSYDAPRRAVYDAALKLATDAGRPASEADADARLWAGFFAAQAERFQKAGTAVTALDLFNRYQFQASAEQAQQTAEAAHTGRILAGAQTLEQPPLPQPSVVDNPNFKRWSKGAPLVEGDIGADDKTSATAMDRIFTETVELIRLSLESSRTTDPKRQSLLDASREMKSKRLEEQLAVAGLTRDDLLDYQDMVRELESNLDSQRDERQRIRLAEYWLGQLSRWFKKETVPQLLDYWSALPAEEKARITSIPQSAQIWRDFDNKIPDPDFFQGVIEKRLESIRTLQDAEPRLRDRVEQAAISVSKKARPDTSHFTTGQPVVVRAFHGTSDYGFTEFRSDKLGSNTGARSAKMAHFFAGKPETSESEEYVGDKQDRWADPKAAAIVLDHARAAFQNLIDAINSFQSMPNTVSQQIQGTVRNSYLAGQPQLLFLDEYQRIEMNEDVILDARYEGETDIRSLFKRLLSILYDLDSEQNPDATELPEYGPVQDYWEKVQSEFDDLEVEEGLPEGSGVYDLFLRFDNPLVVDMKGMSWAGGKLWRHVEKAKEQGHDGVIFTRLRDGGPQDNIYAVLAGHENQIKSTENEEFSDSTDIYRQGPLDPEEQSAYLGSAGPERAQAHGFHRAAAAVHAPDPAVVSKLQSADIPVRDDGSLDAAEIVLNQTRNWRTWVTNFEKNETASQIYSPEQIESMRLGVERTVAHFGDFSLLPQEFEDQSPIRTNDDFFRFTIDISTVCPRQHLYVATIEQVERHLGQILDPYDRLLLGEMLREYGLKPACWYCYGQASRDRFEQIISTASQESAKYLAALRAGATEDELRAVLRWSKNKKGEWVRGKEKGVLDPDKSVLAFIRKRMADITPEMLSPSRMLDLARKRTQPESPLEAELAQVIAGHAQGSSLQNAPKPWASVRDQILRLRDETIAFINRGTGVRLNSQTDFEPWHGVELIQILWSLGAKRAMAHAYTKEADFVRAFGRTGIKFNLSAAYAIDRKTGQILLDSRGLPVFDDVAGMAGEDIEALRKQFPRDVGGMLVATTKEQAWIGLDDQRIDQIIPFHAGPIPARAVKFQGAQDMSTDQHEHWPEGVDSVTVELHDGRTLVLERGEALTRAHHLNSKAVYLEIIEKAGLTARYQEFVSHPNYMKLVRDIAREPNNQHIVDPTRIDYAVLSKVIDAWMAKGGYETTVPPEAVDDIVRRLRTGDLPREVPGARPASLTVLEQAKPGDQPRGEIRINRKEKKFAINLFETADASSFLHESGHAFLEILLDLSRMKNAPESLKRDVQAILAHLKIEKPSQLKKEHHETFARTLEAVLLEGESPSTEMASTFERFKVWLQQIYGVVRNLDVEVKPEVQTLIQNLFATESEIEQASREQGYQTLFGEAAAAGMSEEEYAAYAERARLAKEEGKANLLRRLALRKKKERDEDYRRERAAVEAEVRAELDRDPVMRALGWLQTGYTPEGVAPPPLLTDAEGKPIRLDKDAIVNDYGPQALAGLPSPRNRRGAYTYQTKDGVHPDTAAQAFGVESGAALLAGLANAPNLQEAVQRETERRMQERYGDLLREREALAEAALDAVHTDAQLDVALIELRQLRRRLGITTTAGAEVVNPAALRAKAREIIRNLPLGQASPRTYAKAEARAREAAFKLAEAGKFHEAYDAKQTEILNAMLFREARAAQDDAETALAFLRRMEGDRARARLGKQGFTYLEQMDALLERFSLKKASKRTLQKRRTLLEWVAEERAQDRDPVVPEWLLDEAQRKHYSELTSAELEDVFNTAQNIWKLARLKEKLQGAQSKRTFANTVELLTSTAFANNKDRGERPWSRTTKAAQKFEASAFERIAGALAKPEQLFLFLDGGTPGAWHETVFAPIREALGRENDDALKITKAILDAIEAVPSARRKEWYSREYTFRSVKETLTLHDVIVIALNTGNESNRSKLLGGKGWDEKQLAEVLEVLTTEDMDFVQSVWNALESLWPQMEALEERLTGLKPVKVPHQGFDFKGKHYGGGYYPVRYDPAYSRQGRAAEDEQFQRLFHPQTARAVPPHGHLIERVEFAAPILLDIDVLANHVQQAIHDIHFREPVLNAWRLLNNDKVYDSIVRTLGETAARELRSWVKYVANERSVASDMNNWFARTLTKGSANITVGVLAYKVTTILTQPLNIFAAVDIVKARYIVDGLATLAMDRSAAVGWVNGKSAMMRHRMNAVDRSLVEAMKAFDDDGNTVREGISRAGMYAIGYADMVSSVPTWIGAYKQHLAQNPEATDAEAVAFADHAVAMTHGTGSSIDSSAIQRHPVLKLIAPFYSYFNVLFNRTWALGRDYRTALVEGRVKDFPSLIGRTLGMLIIPAIVQQLITRRGPDTDDDESVAWWTVRQVMFYPMGTVPLLRDVVSSIEGGYDPRVTPYATVLTRYARAGAAARDALEGDREWSEVAPYAVEIAAMHAGLPTAQPRLTGSYLWDLWTGEEMPQSGWELISNILYGKPYERK